MAGRLNEEIIFTRHYASLCNTLTDVDHLLPYFVQDNIINTNDIQEINAITTTPKKVEKLLSHISGPLAAGDTKGLYTMLTIMKEHGHQSTKDLAVNITCEIKLAIDKTEDEVVSTRSQESSDISHQASSSARASGSSEHSTVRTADPRSMQFSTFVATIATLLDTCCGDKLEQSKHFCSNLTISDSFDDLLFNDEQLQKINACSSFRELFVILRKHWSYINYSILTYIISITDSKKAKDELKLFKTTMAYYEGMEILSEDIPLSTEYKKLSVIIEKPYQVLTLDEYTKLRDFVFENLDISTNTALPHVKFLHGSLHLEWHVLKKAAAHMIKMAKQNEEVFTSNSVLFIQIDQSVVLDTTSKDKKQMDDHISASFSYRSGGYDNHFVDTPHDRLVCKICHLPCHKAQQSECCGHVYCKCDVDRLKATTELQLCPICRAKDFVTYPNLEIDDEILQLMVYCPDKEVSGCDWIGKLKDVDRHYNYGRECETECEKCKTTVKHKLLHSHLDTECPCYCPYCDITAEMEVISSEHKEKCHKFPLTCPNNCRLNNIPRDSMDEHKKECPLEMIQCEFNNIGCEAKMCRKDEESHAKDCVTTHLQLTQRRLTILDNMLEDSNTRQLESSETFTVLLSELQERIRTFEEVHTDQSSQSTTKAQSVDVDVQTDVNSTDMLVATSTFSKLIRYFIMPRNPNILGLMMLLLSIVIPMLALYVNYNTPTTTDYSPPTVQEFHEKVSVALYELIDQSTLPWCSKLYYWSNTATIVTPVVVKFSEFSKQKYSILYSSMFFGFTNGYLLRLRVYPSGSPGIASKHLYMSVYLDFMVGPHDNTLDKLGYFPINKSFTIELLNPNDDNSHLQKEISCNIPRVIGDDGSTKHGRCGFSTFISLEGYDFEHKCTCGNANVTICCYLTDDDTIYFRVQEGKQRSLD